MLYLHRKNSSGCSAVRLARQLRELEVAGSNPVSPTNSVGNQHNMKKRYPLKDTSFCFCLFFLKDFKVIKDFNDFNDLTPPRQNPTVLCQKSIAASRIFE